jgi:hypothetical protein
MKKWMGWALIVLLSTGMIITGCSDDDDPTDPGETPTIYPDPDQLVQGFVTVYGDMDQDEFAGLIHADARLIILPSTLSEWEGSGNPLALPYFDESALLAIHDNIFSGEMGMDAVGSNIPPVATISVDFMTKVGAWAPIPDTDPDFGDQEGVWVMYDMLVYFNNPDLHRYQLNSRVAFFVTEVDYDGEVGWQILGLRELSDFAGSEATEQNSWCSILSLYR